MVSLVSEATGLPITEAYLEPSRKSTMKLFAKIVTTKLFSQKWVLNAPLFYLLPKVHGMST